MTSVTQQTWATEMGDIRELRRLLRSYYQTPSVRERMLEFLGGKDPETVTALYITGIDGSSEFGEWSPPVNLALYLDAGFEVDRSMWDKNSLIAHVDLEFHNFDHPVTPWLDPKRAFGSQQPVLSNTLRILSKVGIAPLTLITGRGFHLVWTILRTSKAFRRLAALGYVPPSLQTRYTQSCSPGGACLDLDLGRAFAGLGLIMEFVGHKVLVASNGNSPSVQLATIEVGPGIYGREIIVLDLSEYGDPLHTRRIRVPFSAYLKPIQLRWLLGDDGLARLLPIFEIPLCGMTSLRALTVARDPEAVIELARHSSGAMPDASEPMNRLLDEYQASKLSDFHESFHREIDELAAPHPHPDLREIRIPGAPECVQWLFEHPNDALLKPAALQHIVRTLMALDWKPASIARLIWSSYLQDCYWRDLWLRLDPCSRALFYTRLFAGMIVTGVDKLIDFNCVSHQEKGYCPTVECHSNLINYRDRLLERRNH